jgi:hypothetical protein
MVPKIGILVAKPFVFHAGDRCVRKLFAVLELLKALPYRRCRIAGAGVVGSAEERDCGTIWQNGKRVFFTMI